MQSHLGHKYQYPEMFAQGHPLEQIKYEGHQVECAENQIEDSAVVITEQEEEGYEANK